MSEKICGIYQILNTANGKCYIGSSVNIKTRWGQHKRKLTINNSPNIKLQQAWNKHGEISFEFNIIELVTDNKEELYKKEQFYINKFDSVNNGYNILPSAGSRFGYKASEETKNKLSKAKRGEKHPFYGKRGEDASAYGYKHTEEAKRKISMALSGENNPNYGKKGKIVSAETRAKISSANKGRKHSEESLRKMSIAQKGKVRSSETREKLSASHVGHSPTQETLDKKSESMRIHWENKRADGERHPNYKKVLSPETRAKMAASQAERRAREKALKTAT